jgi:uncharacterized protein YyaL (SSP411 family)
MSQQNATGSHMTAPRSTHQNRLAHETSPYLLQHQSNPVDWWPWGTAALLEAKRSNKPILLSVGYAACHWCHVMAHESFEDEATAAVMNELFVNIKVDREERPDIDQIYMSALHLLGERGGWPMTMFLTPAGEPFWGGTYFPSTSQFGRPAFVDVLRNVARIFHEEPQNVEQNRAALMARLAESARPKGRVTIGMAELDRAAEQIGGLIDPVHGGLRGAPKFPQTMILEFLWRAGQRTGAERYFAAVELSLEHICQGGIYDHLGGGFSRYSVDERWLVPHFEKMLYDNALLLELLALAYQRSGRELFRTRARETVEWLGREMTTPEGAFSASLDADSEGEEGKFYVWSLAEIADVLGLEDAAFFAAHYDVTPEGNFEGHNILNRLNDLPRNMEDEPRLAPLRQRLLSARSRRARPGLDDKILADWNGLMIAALVNASVVLDEPSWLQNAARAFLFIDGKMGHHGERLGHSWRDGRLLVPGLASDHAAMIRAALALHEATGEGGYLERAVAWQTGLDRHYANAETGGYFLTADDAEGLVVRPNSTADEATPNPNAVAAQNLVRLAFYTGQDAWRAQADKLLDGLLPIANENLFMHVGILNALDLRLRAAEIVVVGSGPQAHDLIAAALKAPFLDRIVLRAPTAESLPNHHPAQSKLRSAPGAAAYVCVGETCSLPVASREQLSQALASMRPVMAAK